MPLQPFYTDKNTAKALINAAKDYAVPKTTDKPGGIKPNGVNTQFQNTCKFKLTSDWKSDGNVHSASARKVIYIEGQYVIRDVPNDTDFIIYTDATSRPKKDETITATRKANRWELISGGGGEKDDSIYVQVEPKAKGAACEFRNEQPLFGIKHKDGETNEVIATWDFVKYSEKNQNPPHEEDPDINKKYQYKADQFTFEPEQKTVSSVIDLWGWNKTTDEKEDGVPQRRVYLGFRGVRVRIDGQLVDPDDITCSEKSIEGAVKELAPEEWDKLYNHWKAIRNTRITSYRTDIEALTDLKKTMLDAEATFIVAQKTGSGVAAAQTEYTAAQAEYAEKNTLVNIERKLYDAAIEKCRKFKTNSYKSNDKAVEPDTIDWELYDDKDKVDEKLETNTEELTALKDELTKLQNALTPLQTAAVSAKNVLTASTAATAQDAADAYRAAMTAAADKEKEVVKKEFDVRDMQNMVDDGKSYQKAIDDHLAELEKGFMRVLAFDGKPKKHGVTPAADTVTFTYPRKILLDEAVLDEEKHQPVERADALVTVEFYLRPHHDWYILSAGGLTETIDEEGMTSLAALQHVYSFDLNTFEWRATRFPQMPRAQYNFDMAVFPYEADSSIDGGKKEKIYRLIALGGQNIDGDPVQLMYYVDLNSSNIKWYKVGLKGESKDVTACCFHGRPMLPWDTTLILTKNVTLPQMADFQKHGGVENGERNGIGYNEHVLIIGGGDSSMPYAAGNGERFVSPQMTILPGIGAWTFENVSLKAGQLVESCCFVFNVKSMNFVNKPQRGNITTDGSSWASEIADIQYHRMQSEMACGIKRFKYYTQKGNSNQWGAGGVSNSIIYETAILFGGFPNMLTSSTKSDWIRQLAVPVSCANNDGYGIGCNFIHWGDTGRDDGHLKNYVTRDDAAYHECVRVMGDGAIAYDAKNDKVFFFGGRKSRTNTIPSADVLYAMPDEPNPNGYFDSNLIHSFSYDEEKKEWNTDPYPDDPLKMPTPRYALEAVLVRDHARPEAGVLNDTFFGCENPQTRVFTMFGYEEGNVLSNAMNVFNITDVNDPYWEV